MLILDMHLTKVYSALQAVQPVFHAYGDKRLSSRYQPAPRTAILSGRVCLSGTGTRLALFLL